MLAALLAAVVTVSAAMPSSSAAPIASPPAHTGRMVPVDPARMYAEPAAFAIAVGPRRTVLVAEGIDRIASFASGGTRTDIKLPKGSKADLVCATPDGAIWYANRDQKSHSADAIGRVAPNGAISHFPIRRDGPVSAIAPAADGSLWVADSASSGVLRIDPRTRAIRTLDVGAGRFFAAGITTGHNGDLWIADAGTKAIIRVRPTGARHRFPVPTVPGKIAADAAGGVWFIEDNGGSDDAISRLTPDGRFQRYALHSAPAHFGGAALPQALAAAPDGVWIVNGGNDDVVRIGPDGRLKKFKAPFRADPSDVALGPDGRLWLVETENEIGAMDRTTGATDEHALLPPEAADLIRPDYVLPLASGAVWLIGSIPNSSRSTDRYEAVGLVKPDGSYVEYDTPSLVAAATTAPNGELWYALENDAGIRRLSLDGTRASWPITGINFIDHLTADPDGSVWALANQRADSVYHITADGHSELVHVPNPIDLVRAPDGPAYVVTCPKACVPQPLDSGANRKPPVPASWDPPNVAIASDGATWSATKQLSADGTLHYVLFRVGTDGVRRSVTVFTGKPSPAQDGSVWADGAEEFSGRIRRIDAALHVKTFALPFVSVPEPAIAMKANTAWFGGHLNDFPMVFEPTFGSVTADGSIHEYRIEPNR